jgi:hypothetical protein
MHGWPMLVWEEEKRFTQRSLRTQRTQRREERVTGLPLVENAARRRDKNIEARSGSAG